MGGSQCHKCEHLERYLVYWREETEDMSFDLMCKKGWLESDGDCPTFSPERQHTNNHNREARQ